MSTREEEIELGADTEAAGDDDLPIVLLPDDLDAEDLLAESPEPELPAAAPAAAPVIRKAPSMVAAQLIAADLLAPDAEAPLSLADIAEELETELSLERQGWRNLFSMPRLCCQAALGVVGLLGLVLYLGWEYYWLPLTLRPLHHLHWVFRPSGALGLSLGILGVLVMLASLAYLVRKGLPSLQKAGPLQSWMGFHIVTGLIGPAIALFHAAFVPTSALGLLAVGAMGVVIVSGIVGRYVAVCFPRSLTGRELKFEEIRGRLIVYRKKLVELGVDPEVLRVDAPDTSRRAPWLLASLIRVLRGDWESRREFRNLRQSLFAKGQMRIEMELVLFLVRRLCWERQWLVRYGEFRRLVGAWRFFHRWFAITLLLAVFFHVVVAMRFGGLWILGGRR